LLLLAGANPNTATDVFNCAPPLCVAAREGYADVVSLYVEFGAEVNATDDEGVPALAYAARRGHVNIIHLLTTRHAKVGSEFTATCNLWFFVASKNTDVKLHSFDH